MTAPGGPGASEAAERPERLVVVDGGDRVFANTAARLIAEGIREAVARAGRCSLSLAGGSTPRETYERLAALPDVPWSDVHVYFGDERAVPPDDPESNHRLARETLLTAPIPPEQVHRLEGEASDLEAAARAAEAELPEALDLCLLGLGDDAHVASLFPGSPALGVTQRRVVPVTGPKPPPRRLTITPPVLAAARRLVVLARGAGKADAVARALEGAEPPGTVPGRLARRGTWILDAEAAERLGDSFRPFDGGG